MEYNMNDMKFKTLLIFGVIGLIIIGSILNGTIGWFNELLQQQDVEEAALMIKENNWFKWLIFGFLFYQLFYVIFGFAQKFTERIYWEGCYARFWNAMSFTAFKTLLITLLLVVTYRFYNGTASLLYDWIVSLDYETLNELMLTLPWFPYVVVIAMLFFTLIPLLALVQIISKRVFAMWIVVWFRRKSFLFELGFTISLMLMLGLMAA